MTSPGTSRRDWAAPDGASPSSRPTSARLTLVADKRISTGDDDTQDRAVDLYRQLTTAWTLGPDEEVVGQITGDVLAEIREDPELCAAFLTFVGVGFQALVGQLAAAKGVSVEEMLPAAWLAYEDDES